MSKVKPPVKLNAPKARSIRERFAAGDSMKTLAEAYSVSETTIRDVLRYETWGRAGGPRLDPQKSEI
jgi:hypothetical protein